MRPLTIDRQQARRIAVRAQLLDLPRPTDLVEVVNRLTEIQNDPTAAVAPSLELVPWSRLGASYQRAEMTAALERDGTLFELHSFVRPMADLRLYLADMQAWPTRDEAREWLEVNEPFRYDILDRLEAQAPLLSREIPDTSVVPWQSSGWTNNRNVTQMLEFLMMRGEVAIAGRRAGQRLWDLAERVYPDTPVVPREEARRIRQSRRLAALGIMRENAPGAPAPASGSAAPVIVDGVPGRWLVDPAQLDQPFTGRTALLSPLDRLVYDRSRLLDLFEYEYVLEMYKPKAKRRWGYFALPILHHDRLVGKLDATADRKAGTLRVDAIHEDVRFTKAITRAVHDELADLAEWLRLSLSGPAAPSGRR